MPGRITLLVSQISQIHRDQILDPPYNVHTTDRHLTATRSPPAPTPKNPTIKTPPKPANSRPSSDPLLHGLPRGDKTERRKTREKDNRLKKSRPYPGSCRRAAGVLQKSCKSCEKIRKCADRVHS